MRILSIDPGSIQCGIAIFEGNNLLFHGVLTYKHKLLAVRLNGICDQIEDLLKKYQINKVVLEEVYVGNNSRTAISMGKTMGYIQRTCKEHYIELINAVSARSNLFITTQYRKFKDKKMIKKYIQRFVYLLYQQHISQDASDAIINGLSYIKRILKEN